MANIVRYISPEGVRTNVFDQKFSRPHQTSGGSYENYNFEDRQAKDNSAFLDPHRARLVQVSDPRLRQLRAAKLSPRDRENASRGILEQLLYLAESQLEN